MIGRARLAVVVAGAGEREVLRVGVLRGAMLRQLVPLGDRAEVLRAEAPILVVLAVAGTACQVATVAGGPEMGKAHQSFHRHRCVRLWLRASWAWLVGCRWPGLVSVFSVKPRCHANVARNCCTNPHC